MTTNAASYRTVLLASMLLATAGGCSASSADAPADDAVEIDSAELLATGDPRGNQVRTTTVEVPVSAATITSDGAGVTLKWPDLRRYTALVGSTTLYFEPPPRDGESCDDTCLGAVIARAAARGGKLRGKLRVERKILGIQKSPGVCARILEENVTLDLRAATHGIHPYLESTYGFLTLTPFMPARIELEPMPCK